MNKEWSEINKEMQFLINHKSSFENGKAKLLNLRRLIYSNILELLDKNREDLDKMPYINSEGYVNKNVMYSIYHIFRIEDIVTNILMLGHEKDIFLSENYQEKLNSSIITTGNELVKEKIESFTKGLNLMGLVKYIEEVYNNTNKLIINLTHQDLKTKVTEKRKEVLVGLNVVHKDAEFLIDYWCGKDFYGLIKMPLSRHWIMHIEAANRIIYKLNGQRKLNEIIQSFEESKSC